MKQGTAATNLNIGAANQKKESYMNSTFEQSAGLNHSVRAL